MTVKIIGCGNTLAADDGIGSHIIKRLKEMKLPKRVEVIEAGTDPFRLIELIVDAQKLIIIDAASSGDTPGKIHRYLPEDLSPDGNNGLSLHQVSIPEILKIAASLYPDRIPKSILIYGVEAQNLSPFTSGLSKPVETAVPSVIKKILAEIEDNSP